MADSIFLRVAKEAAQKAGKVAQELKKKGYKSKKKGKKKEDELNVVTEADVAAQRAILTVLGKEFPKHAIVAEEESAEVVQESDYVWAVDPIDGTLAYVRGMPYWGVSISLLKDFEPILGVIYMPETDDLYWSEKGKGSFLNGGEIHVSKVGNIEGVLAYISPGPVFIRKEQLNRTRRLLERVGYSATFGAAVAGLTSLACGRLDLYLPSRVVSVWDVAAGAVLVEEAGGRITDFSGGPVRWEEQGGFEFVATNGFVHDEVLELLNR